jgi:uncharacterized protein (TIGR02466 family)
MEKVECLPLFPQLVLKGTEVFDPTAILEWAESFYESNPVGRTVSNEGGWQHAIRMSSDPQKTIFKPLWDAVENMFITSALIGKDVNRTLSLSEAWLNVSNPGDFNWNHTHPKAFYSGVAYLKTPEDSGNIRFICEHEQGSNTDFLNQEVKDYFYVWGSWEIAPEPGMILLFPATLTHRVNPNRSKDSRISLAFNLNI